jgi:glycosyltransferase involved in cell wall biosynthesis
MADVTIAIPTFRRPRGLERLLAALEKLDTTANVSVLVADNDAERGDGAAVCERLRTSGYRWPLAWIVVRERGIAQTRNALVEHVLAKQGAEFVAMIDDDEWPQPQWLNIFLRAQADTGADILYGAVLREFERKPGIWAAYCPGVASTHVTSGPLVVMPGAGNVFRSGICADGRRGQGLLHASEAAGPQVCRSRRRDLHRIRAGLAGQSALGVAARLSHRQFRHARGTEV